MLATTNVSADFVSGDMQLRDAMYIYGQSVDARGSKQLGGYNCDVFQVVMDVTSGYTDLTMYQGNTDTELTASALRYPDRIFDSADMFSYALYQNKTTKLFGFLDKNNPTSTAQVGAGTFFGYCYSTKPDAYVYFREEDKCTVKYLDGDVTPLPNCTPSAGGGGSSTPTPTPAVPGPSDFYGRLTLSYKFNAGTTTYVDTADFSSVNLSTDKTIVATNVRGSSSRYIGCGLSPSLRSHLCLISDTTFGTTELFAFNLSGGQITQGLYEYCFMPLNCFQFFLPNALRSTA